MANKGEPVAVAPEAMEASAESHLLGAGVDRGLIASARAAGLSLSTIIALLVKHGPQAAQIIRDILDALKSKPV